MINLTVQEICEKLKVADEGEFASLKSSLAGDERKGIKAALDSTENRLRKAKAEHERVQAMFDFDERMRASHGGSLILGLDEVGRGCLAGPVAVGGVVLQRQCFIEGLNDSKQIKPAERECLHDEVQSVALASFVKFSSAKEIDSFGIVGALKNAFQSVITKADAKFGRVDVVLLDGNPLFLDTREVNVIKGDATSACIAAASIFAKVERDRLMCEMDAKYPGYEFSTNKGYGTERHRELIHKQGLSDIHRLSFCGEFTQTSLF